MDRVRESRVWLKCTHRGMRECFFWENSLSAAFCLGQNYFLVYIIFRTSMQFFWSHLPPPRRGWTRLLSIMPPMQSTRHFRWGTSYDLFTLGNKWTSCYVTHATYAACQRNITVAIQQFDPFSPTVRIWSVILFVLFRINAVFVLSIKFYYWQSDWLRDKQIDS